MVAILDADKEGFARGAIADSNHRQSSSSCAGQAILYADNLTDSMAKTETERRRQFSWNTTRSRDYARRFSKNLLTQFFPGSVAAAECSAIETV